MTALLIDLPRLQREQAARVWSPRSVPTLRSRSLAVLGQGPVGLEIARRGADLGMRVTAVSRSGDSGPDGLAARRPVEALHEILPDSDVVVLALPSTPQTRHLIDADALALMRPDAILVNIARGAVVDEAALVAALQESRLGAAALDVFEQEPLAADSPLWAMPNVIITPHMSGNPADFCASMAHLFVDNYRRFRDGTDLLNVVDWRRGY
nr:D-2-hydroxyacid dehydrogenase [Acuticoccus mangrovi]